ncbi:uncharacterized protein [Prorops nasuta]|uniref:uncharacterized protein n=1 Tax=Prorops nasuta TaxID=863751 RepID=UPI0034CEC234
MSLRLSYLWFQKYYVAIGEGYCTAVPECWLVLEKQLVWWPPKSLNVRVAMSKGLHPGVEWDIESYNQILGPLDSITEAVALEKRSVAISSGAETEDLVKFVQEEEKKKRKIIRKEYSRLPSTDECSNDEMPNKMLKKDIVETVQLPDPHIYKIFSTGNNTEENKSALILKAREVMEIPSTSSQQHCNCCDTCKKELNKISRQLITIEALLREKLNDYSKSNSVIASDLLPQFPLRSIPDLVAFDYKLENESAVKIQFI